MKKTVRKEWLEDLVVAETMKLIQNDAVIDAIVAEVMELQDQGKTPRSHCWKSRCVR